MRHSALRRFVAVLGAAVVMAGCASAQPPQPRRHREVRGPEVTSPRPPQPSPTDRWTPDPGVEWQYQLDGELDLGVDVDVIVADLFDTTAAQVATLHRLGRRVVCYFSAGSLEDWRPDAEQFPDGVVGEPLEGWPGESWLDISRLDVLEPLMAARLDRCAAKGFDGVEADNVDGHTQRTGFPISADAQLRYNRTLARLAHQRGLAFGLKNDLDQVVELEPHADFAVNESCRRYDECERLSAFVEAGKAVLHVEYTDGTPPSCPAPAIDGFSSILKHRDLRAWRMDC